MKKWLLCFLLLVSLCSLSSAEDLGQIKLSQAIDMALQKNFTLKSVQAQLQGARAKVRISRSGYFPQLSVSGGINRVFSDTPETVLLPGQSITGTQAAGGEKDFTRRSVNFTLSQNIFDFGKRYHTLQESRSNLQAVTENLAASRHEVIFAVERAFYEYFKSLNLLEVARESVRQFELQLQQAEARNSAGLTPLIDVTTARMHLASARSRLQQAQSDVTLAKAALSNAIGLDLGVEYEPVRPVETARSIPSLEELMAALMEHNPAIRQARENVRSAEFVLKSAQSKYWPSLYGQADYLDQVDYWGDDSHRERKFELGLRLDVPLFSGGAKYYGVKSARSELERSQAILEQIIRDARLTVMEDFTNYEKTLSQLVSLKEAGEAAEANLEMATSRYQLGLGDIIEWTNASLNLIVEKTDYVNANYSLLINFASLKRDIGASDLFQVK